MNWKEVAESILAGRAAGRDVALAALGSPDDELLDLLAAAFRLRRARFGRRVDLHVIRNARSGGCAEDCAFCSQSKTSAAPIPAYPMQSAEEIAEGAAAARAAGAVRYCIVASGRGPAGAHVDRICEAARLIRERNGIRLCTSLGELTPEQARRLAEAGVNRYNHNLETSERFFPSICTTHAYPDRVRTVRVARQAGLEVCSGGLLGMGETEEDRVALAFALRELDVAAVPVNLLDPREGTPLAGRPRMTPADGLRALAMFRLVLPDREIRAGGGREAVLRSMQPLALYAANSMFTGGYLTTPGQDAGADRRMLEDAGFEIGEIVSAD